MTRKQPPLNGRAHRALAKASPFAKGNTTPALGDSGTPFVKGDRETVVAVSGGFDPLHIGHVRLFNTAKKLGSKLVVILNNDNWLMAKKGFAFMPEADRKEILESLAAVDEVLVTEHRKDDPDRSVCRELRKLRPDIFANGGDRDRADAQNKRSSLAPEAVLCERLGIRTVFNVGKGGKIRSSSELVNRFRGNQEASRS